MTASGPAPMEAGAVLSLRQPSARPSFELKSSRTMSHAWRTLPHGVRTGLNLLGWASIGIFTARHVVSFANISGASMQPTFNPELHKNPLQSDVVLLKRFGFDHGRFDTRKSYRRGDVVTLWSPMNPEMLTTKRIVALEGDIVTPIAPSHAAAVRIPQGHCWVEGDSNYRTVDSNTYGPVPVALITGRVVAIVWPWERRQWIEPGLGKAEGRVRVAGAPFVYAE